MDLSWLGDPAAQICRLPGEQAQLSGELARAETGDDGLGRPRGCGPDDLPQELLRLLGACWDRARRRLAAPSAATTASMSGTASPGPGPCVPGCPRPLPSRPPP